MAVRSNLCNNSSLRNYNKKNLYKAYNKVDNLLNLGNFFNKKKVLTPNEINKLKDAKVLIKDVLDNYKEEYFKNRDSFK